MTNVFKIFLSVVLMLMLASLGFPHHAMEYIEMESYSTAQKGQFVFHLHFDYMVEDKSNPFLDHYEFTPGLSYGITDRLMIDAHTHFAKFGNDHVLPEYRNDFSPVGPSPFLEAAAFAIQYRVTKNWFLDIALGGIYEIPFNRSKELLDGQEVFEGMLILSKTFHNHANLCFNLKYGKDGDETVQQWALGFKMPLTAMSHGINAGVELLGDFDSGDVSILPGFYLPLGGENVILKSGLEIGLNNDILRMNVTLMYLF